MADSGSRSRLRSKAGAPRKHHAAMDYRDLPSFMAKLAGCDTVAARALRFKVLTACRTGESLGMTWDEISFEAGTGSIEGRRMKTGKRHNVPLSDQGARNPPRTADEAAQSDVDGDAAQAYGGRCHSPRVQVFGPVVDGRQRGAVRTGRGLPRPHSRQRDMVQA